jgi:hypothetical protein
MQLVAPGAEDVKPQLVFVAVGRVGQQAVVNIVVECLKECVSRPTTAPLPKFCLLAVLYYCRHVHFYVASFSLSDECNIFNVYQHHSTQKLSVRVVS